MAGGAEVAALVEAAVEHAVLRRRVLERGLGDGTSILTPYMIDVDTVAGDGGDALREALGPLLDRFRTSLKQTGAGRRARGAPRRARSHWPSTRT